MRKRRVYSTFSASLLVGLLMGCNAIVGTEDIVYDDLDDEGTGSSSSGTSGLSSSSTSGTIGTSSSSSSGTISHTDGGPGGAKDADAIVDGDADGDALGADGGAPG